MLDWSPSQYGDDWADRYDCRFGHLADTAPAVEVLARLAGPGPILELGIGTGRLALPLAASGFEIHGVEASDKMIEKLRAKEHGADIPIVARDFTDFSIPHRYALIYLSCNTLFDTPRQEQQVSCIAAAARHLRDDGVIVVEAAVPDLARFSEGRFLRVAKATDSELVVDTVLHHAATQQTFRRRISFTAEHGIEFQAIRNRYIWPAEMDLMAALAHLRLRERWSGWEREAFTDKSTGHVSLYEPA